MDGVDLLVILILASAILFLISSLLVNKFVALWIRWEGFQNNFNLAGKRIRAISCFIAIFSALIFSFLFSSLEKIKSANFSQTLHRHSIAAINNSNAFTGVLAVVDIRLFRTRK